MKLKGKEKLLALGPAFRLMALGIVERVQLYPSLLECPSRLWSHYDMRLLLRTDQPPRFWVECECSNVIDLRVEQSGCGVLGLIYFALDDISSRGLQEGRWEIAETDGDKLTFQCDEIKVVRAGAGDPPAEEVG